VSGSQSSRLDLGLAISALGNKNVRQGKWGGSSGLLGDGERLLARFTASQASATRLEWYNATRAPRTHLNALSPVDSGWKKAELSNGSFITRGAQTLGSVGMCQAVQGPQGPPRPTFLIPVHFPFPSCAEQPPPPLCWLACSKIFFESYFFHLTYF
jgi:hypothetical protein